MLAPKKLTHEQKLERWKKALKRLQMNPRQVAEKIGVTQNSAYSWNCGYTSIPEARLKQVEEL
jgi:hypothetical protein